MLPGKTFAAAVSAALQRLGADWAVVSPDAGVGIPLDDAGSLLLSGPADGTDLAAAEVAVLSHALTLARADVAAAVASVAGPGEGERALPTTLGGPVVWKRVCAEAATAGLGLPDAHAVVIVRTDEGSDRTAQRTAATLRRTVRDQDVVCRLATGTYAVLALCCPNASVPPLADRLVTALLDVGVGAATGAVTDVDPARAAPVAASRAEHAWAERQVLRP